MHYCTVQFTCIYNVLDRDWKSALHLFNSSIFLFVLFEIMECNHIPFPCDGEWKCHSHILSHIWNSGKICFHTNTIMNVKCVILCFIFHVLVTNVMSVNDVMSTSNDGFRHPVIPRFILSTFNIDTGYRNNL